MNTLDIIQIVILSIAGIGGLMIVIGNIIRWKNGRNETDRKEV